MREAADFYMISDVIKMEADANIEVVVGSKIN